MSKAAIRLKRVYEKPSKDDSKRILVERLWPRGLTKAKAKIDVWMKDIAPSTELRQWYAHDEKKWPAFRKKYLAELRKNKKVVAELKETIGKSATFVYAAKDEEHNSAVILRNFLL
ncbi:MAG TPA: DUF488 family protein [Candidatus Peribacteraceae bacterium]|nr:DUF488 family protein [Candidatus Peribacteraceae bacterium]